MWSAAWITGHATWRRGVAARRSCVTGLFGRVCRVAGVNPARLHYGNLYKRRKQNEEKAKLGNPQKGLETRGP
jgi:hypothetical protein